MPDANALPSRRPLLLPALSLAKRELVRFLRNENVPGRFPFTAGVFAFKREDEDPARLFAGEGGPASRRHIAVALSPICP